MAKHEKKKPAADTSWHADVVAVKRTEKGRAYAILSDGKARFINDEVAKALVGHRTSLQKTSTKKTSTKKKTEKKKKTRRARRFVGDF